MPPRETPPIPATPVEELWNLSAKTAGWLREEGIRTHGELSEADLLALFLQLKAQHRQVTRLLYYALWGARENRHWRQCPEEEKAAVADALAALERRVPR